MSCFDLNKFIFLVFCTTVFIFAKELYLTYSYSVNTYYDNYKRLQGNEFNNITISVPSKVLYSNTTKVTTKKLNSTNTTSVTQVKHTINSAVVNNTVPIKKKHGLTAYERKVLRRKQQREEFLHLLQQQQNEDISKDKNDTKYVIFYPIQAGFGNLINVMVEAIVVSFLTNRRFYIYNYPIFGEYFDLPFKYYNYPNDDFLKEDHLMIKNTCTYLETDILNSTKKYIVFRNTCKMINYLTYSDQYYNFFYEHGFVIDEKGDIGAHIRKQLLHFLYTKVVSPKPFVMQAVNDVKRRLEWDKYYIIGLQIRSGHTKIDTYITYFLYKEDIHYFALKAQELTKIANKTQSKPVKWFLTCDSETERDKFKSTYGNIVIYSGCKAAHSLSDMYKKTNTSEMLCTLVDGYLLGSSDVAIITGRSTYGVWATNQNIAIKRFQVRKGEWKNYMQNKNKHK